VNVEPASSSAEDDEVVALCRALIRVDTTNPPGRETAAAELLGDYLSAAGVACELVARQADRANLVALLPGAGTGPSMAFVGHTDVVPSDARDWTHPPFAAVVDDDGYLFGRGAIDMKGEVAARAVAIARLARSGFRPSGDLWLLAVADEEDGTADVGMRWLLEQRPDIRPHLSLNEGGGQQFVLTDGRRVSTVAVGEKGTYPARVVALGEAGHASVPDLGDNAVPHLGELLARIGRGRAVPSANPSIEAVLAVLVDHQAGDDLVTSVTKACELHPALSVLLWPMSGTTMAPTMLSASNKRNVLPARAGVELDCRILPGTSEVQVEREVRSRLGTAVAYELEWPEPLIPGSSSPAEGPLWEACRRRIAAMGDGAIPLPVLDTGYTDSAYLRWAAGTVAYGFSPMLTTPVEVADAGYHNKDERVHIDDLVLSADFHEQVARDLLGG
jgi:acetylornithine deacetylase/succinyl-diaminopimelate desuccinylase-like protein